MIVPQAMAYAMLAGLPPVTGLYAAMLPLVVYAALGTSRHLSVGPVAIDSLLVASGLGMMAVTSADEYLALAITLAVMVGLVQMFLGMARLGFVVNFLSNPVLSGFTSAAALIIGLSQLKHLLGFAVPGARGFFPSLAFIIENAMQSHLPTLLLGAACLVVLVLVKWLRPSFPGALLVVAGSIAMVYFWRLDFNGVRIVGVVPEGLPSPAFGSIRLGAVNNLVPLAMTIALISFMEAIASAKRLAVRHGYEVDANRELVGIGAANMVAGFSGGYPIAGSFSRSALNSLAGGNTQMSSLISALLIALVLLFLTPYFYFMPNAALAVIIIVAVAGLVDVREARRLWRVKRSDFTVLLFAFVATLLMGVQNGILLSIAASMLMIFRRITHPHIALMGRIPGTDVFRNFERAPAAEIVSGVIIFRIDASLYFANINYLKDNIFASIRERQDRIHTFIFDASSINEIDTSASAVLLEIVDDLAEQKITLYFTNVHGPVRDMMQRSGLYEKLGEDHFFFSKRDAVCAALKSATT